MTTSALNPSVAAPASFEEQMATLHTRSDATLHLGPPPWLTRPPCAEGPLTADELTQFFQDGFFIKHHVFTRAELEPVMHDIAAQVDKVAHKLFKAGRITDLCADQGFYQRMHGLEKQYKGASVLLHKSPDLPPSFQRLWTDPRLLDAAQQLLGGPAVDVAGHPVWNLRVKVLFSPFLPTHPPPYSTQRLFSSPFSPTNLSTHPPNPPGPPKRQLRRPLAPGRGLPRPRSRPHLAGHGVDSPDRRQGKSPTHPPTHLFIYSTVIHCLKPQPTHPPTSPSTIQTENGCMQMIRRAHRTGKTAKHTCCAGGTWYVEMDMDDASFRLGVDCKVSQYWWVGGWVGG